jgi:hypothetical protein
MHKSVTKCNKTLGKWCKNKHGASKIIDTFWTYHMTPPKIRHSLESKALSKSSLRVNDDVWCLWSTEPPQWHRGADLPLEARGEGFAYELHGSVLERDRAVRAWGEDALNFRQEHDVRTVDVRE